MKLNDILMAAVLGAITLAVAATYGWQVSEMLLAYWIEFAIFSLAYFVKMCWPVFEEVRKEKGLTTALILIPFGAFFLVALIGIIGFISLMFVYGAAGKSMIGVEWWQFLLYPLGRLDIVALAVFLVAGQGLGKLKMMGLVPVVIGFERFLVLLVLAFLIFYLHLSTGSEAIWGLGILIAARTFLAMFPLNKIIFLRPPPS